MILERYSQPSRISGNQTMKMNGIRNKFHTGLYYCSITKSCQTQDSSVDGVLGGYGHVSPIDLDTSNSFLKNFKYGKGRALDCGAGIGRITKFLLLDHFEKVDLVEPCPKYIEEAKKYVESDRVEK